MSIFRKIALGALSFLIFWAAGFGVFTLATLLRAPQAVDETTDAIVVLTGGNGRIQEGMALFASGRASHLFISGVYKDVTRREIMGLWKGDHALPPCCVTLGYEATTTTQNAQETRAWIIKNKYSSIRLVTGDYHMARSMMELRHALPGVDIFRHPVRQDDLRFLSLRYWELMFSEYHKSLYRRVQLLVTPRRPLDEEHS